MSIDDSILFDDVEIGPESKYAVKVLIESEWHWIPLSAVTRMKRDPSVKGQDSIWIAEWCVRMKGIR